MVQMLTTKLLTNFSERQVIKNSDKVIDNEDGDKKKNPIRLIGMIMIMMIN